MYFDDEGFDMIPIEDDIYDNAKISTIILAEADFLDDKTKDKKPKPNKTVKKEVKKKDG